MSLLDIRQAKEALTWRLKEWGVDGDWVKLASSFIDDLVEKGWRMDATREDRPRPPKAHEACRRCGGRLPDCACTREHLAAEYDDGTPPAPATRTGPDAARAALRGAERATTAGGERDA